jgi:hypothetical protein
MAMPVINTHAAPLTSATACDEGSSSEHTARAVDAAAAAECKLHEAQEARAAAGRQAAEAQAAHATAEAAMNALMAENACLSEQLESYKKRLLVAQRERAKVERVVDELRGSERVAATARLYSAAATAQAAHCRAELGQLREAHYATQRQAGAALHEAHARAEAQRACLEDKMAEMEASFAAKRMAEKAVASVQQADLQAQVSALAAAAEVSVAARDAKLAALRAVSGAELFEAQAQARDLRAQLAAANARTQQAVAAVAAEARAERTFRMHAEERLEAAQHAAWYGAQQAAAERQALHEVVESLRTQLAASEHQAWAHGETERELCWELEHVQAALASAHTGLACTQAQSADALQRSTQQLTCAWRDADAGRTRAAEAWAVVACLQQDLQALASEARAVVVERGQAAQRAAQLEGQLRYKMAEAERLHGQVAAMASPLPSSPTAVPCPAASPGTPPMAALPEEAGGGMVGAAGSELLQWHQRVYQSLSSGMRRLARSSSGGGSSSSSAACTGGASCASRTSIGSCSSRASSAKSLAAMLDACDDARFEAKAAAPVDTSSCTGARTQLQLGQAPFDAGFYDCVESV